MPHTQTRTYMCHLLGTYQRINYIHEYIPVKNIPSDTRIDSKYFIVTSVDQIRSEVQTCWCALGGSYSVVFRSDSLDSLDRAPKSEDRPEPAKATLFNFCTSWHWFMNENRDVNSRNVFQLFDNGLYINFVLTSTPQRSPLTASYRLF